VDYPLYLAGRRVGVLHVTVRGADTRFEARAPALRGLHRIYVQGERGRLLLGAAEDGTLGRSFSPALTAPIGRIQCGRAESSAGAVWTGVPPEGAVLWPDLPPETLFCRRGGRYYLALPWDESAPFPLEELFCFARVRRLEGRWRAIFAFDRDGRPLMEAES
jgi:hypothetical protein